MDFNINQMDLVLLVITLVFMIRGILKGFVAEALSMAAIVLAIAAGVIFSGSVSILVNEYLGETMWSQVIAFLAIFILVYVIVKLLEGGMQAGIEKLNLDKLDKVLGFFLGFIEGVLIIAILIFILHVQPFFNFKAMFKNSFFANLIIPFIPSAADIFNI